MNSKSVATLIVSVAIAFAAGWWSASSNDDDATARPGSADEMHEQLGSALDTRGTLPRSQALVRLAAAVDDNTIDGVERAFAERLDTVEAFDFKLFADVWADLDADDLLATVNEWPSSRHQRLAMAATIHAWVANGQTERAMTLAKGQTDRDARLGSLTALLHAWVEIDPDRSMDTFIGGFEKDEDREILTGIAASLIIQRRGEAGLREWIEDFPADAPPAQKRLSFHQSISKLAKQNPSAAVEWIQASGDAPWSQGIHTTLARSWSLFDSEAAIEWAIGIEETQARARAVAAILKRWSRQDPFETAAWIERQEPAPRYDGTLEQLAMRLASSKPKRAIQLASRIHSDERKASVVERIRNVATREGRLSAPGRRPGSPAKP